MEVYVMEKSVRELAKTLKATGFIVSEEEAIKRAQEIIKSEKQVLEQQRNATKESLKKAEILKEMRLGYIKNQNSEKETQEKTNLGTNLGYVNKEPSKQETQIQQEIIGEVLEEPIGNTNTNQQTNQQNMGHMDTQNPATNQIGQEVMKQFKEETTQDKTRVIKTNKLSDEEKAILREKHPESRVDLTNIFKV